MKANLNKSFIDAVSLPPSGRVEYYDTKINGLCLRVSSSGIKVLYYSRRYRRQLVRIKIGKWPDISVEMARNKVSEYNAKVAQRINPLAEVKADREQMTFDELFTAFMERWSRPSKKTSHEDESIYKRYISRHLKNKALSEITKKDIAHIFSLVSKNYPYRANRVLSVLSSVFNRGIEWGLCEHNPCRGIKKNREKSRERFLTQEELPIFFDAVKALKSPIMEAYFLISLFTGARQGNVLAMRWKEIDFRRKEWFIAETKNGTSQRVPLIPAVIDILKNLKHYNEFVFYSPTSKSGHIEEPKKAWKKIVAYGKFEDLRIHDLRRTFGSWQAITGASLAIIGKSLNHKSATATQVYARLSNDPIRDAMQKAGDEMIKHSKSQESPL